MPMTRSKRFQPIVRLAEHGQDEAARRLGEAQQAVEAQRQRLEDIKGYRDEYARRFDEAAAGGINGMLVQDFRVFLTRLNEAIEQQARVVELAEREWETCRAGWLEARTRVGALDVAVERFCVEEQVVEARREQQATDEHAQRRTTSIGTDID